MDEVEEEASSVEAVSSTVPSPEISSIVPRSEVSLIVTPFSPSVFKADISPGKSIFSYPNKPLLSTPFTFSLAFCVALAQQFEL